MREVNGEFENIKLGLKGALNCINDDGKIVVITFHSLEDRIVKQFVKDNHLTAITKKPIMAKSDLSFEKTARLRAFKK